MKKRGGKNGVAIVATLAILCPGFIAAEAQAQTCAGLASYDSAPFRAVGNGAFNDDVTSFSGGFSYGNTGFFGGLGIGVVNVDVLDGSGFAVSGQAGYETALDSKGAVYLCPLAGISFLSGPTTSLGWAWITARRTSRLVLPSEQLQVRQIRFDSFPRPGLDSMSPTGNSRTTSAIA